MKISEIYDTALYLAEKLNDSTGFIDAEYRDYHKMKALEIIKQSAASIAQSENIPVLEIGRLGLEDELNLPFSYCKFIIPLYLAAVLCEQDGEDDKYNFFIYEYQNKLNHIKHDEESVFEPSVLEGLR